MWRIVEVERRRPFRYRFFDILVWQLQVAMLCEMCILVVRQRHHPVSSLFAFCSFMTLFAIEMFLIPWHTMNHGAWEDQLYANEKLDVKTEI